MGASALPRRPRGSLALIALGAALAPAGTTIGILAAPLAILRAVLAPCSRRLKLFAVLAALSGVLAYVEACNLGGSDTVNSARVQNVSTIEPIAGLGYALAVPGRMLWPSTLGVPATWLATVPGPLAVWGAGIAALSATLWLVSRQRAKWNRQLILVGAAMIYCGYVITYLPRVWMLRMNRWTELEFLYQAVGRYHVLPLMGLAAIVAAVISCWPRVGRFDAQKGLPAFAGAVVGLVMLVVQWKEASYWDFYLLEQDQKATFAALDALGKLAREEGISRAQLVRIIDPVMRPWNVSILVDRPAAFPLVKLAAHAPLSVAQPIGDDVALARLRKRLSPAECKALGADMCVSLYAARPAPGARTVAVGRRYDVYGARELSAGHYQNTCGAGFIGFEFEPAPEARYLVLPGLKADQDVNLYWCDQKRQWRPGQGVRWLKSPACDGPVVIDLERLIHLSVKPLSRIVIQFTRPGGEIVLEGSPRLLR